MLCTFKKEQLTETKKTNTKYISIELYGQVQKKAKPKVKSVKCTMLLDELHV